MEWNTEKSAVWKENTHIRVDGKVKIKAELLTNESWKKVEHVLFLWFSLFRTKISCFYIILCDCGFIFKEPFMFLIMS